jgi:raffinose/stachyose/melibiose transport system permease protein
MSETKPTDTTDLVVTRLKMKFKRSSSTLRTRSSPVERFFEWLIVVVVLVISIYPLLWLVQSSLKSETQIFLSPFALPSPVDWANYEAAFSMGSRTTTLATFFRNSVLIAGCTVVLSVFIYSLGGYVVARESFRGKGVLISLLALSLLLPRVALMFPLFLYSHLTGLYDTLWVLIIAYTAFQMPLSVFVLRSYFLTIPRALEESAYIDGATYLQAFLRIVLPLAKPALATVAILVFIGSWNEFSFALLLTASNQSRTIPVALASFNSIYGSNIGAMFAGMVIVVAPAILIFILFQKRIVSGLASGSIKQ